MKTLYERLIQACKDQGIESPRGVDIQKITGVSSGRVTQIKHEGEAAKLGESAIAKLVAAGFSRDWIQYGKLPMKINHSAASSDSYVLSLKPKTQRESRIERITVLLNEMDDSGIAIMLDKAKDVANEYPMAKQTQSYS